MGNTLAPKYILCSYMDPLGNGTLQPSPCATRGFCLPAVPCHRRVRVPLRCLQAASKEEVLQKGLHLLGKRAECRALENRVHIHVAQRQLDVFSTSGLQVVVQVPQRTISLLLIFHGGLHLVLG